MRFPDLRSLESLNGKGKARVQKIPIDRTLEAWRIVNQILEII